MKKLLLLLPLLLLSSCSSIGINKNTSSNQLLNHDQPYGYAIDDKIVRKGKESQRFEIRHGDCGYDKKWNDCEKDRRRYERYVKSTMVEKPENVVWYAYSIYLPESFPKMHPTKTTLGQVKVINGREPLWYLSAGRKGIRIRYDASLQECKLVRRKHLLGQWTDFLIKVDYSTNDDPNKLYSEVYVNGERKDCDINEPVLTKEFRNINKKFSFRYGIYNSYVSRWLNENKTKEVKAKGFSDYHEQTGMIVNSVSNTPWDIDWGVKLPTQVVYYDEIRIGPTRESVDINMNDSVD